MKLSFSISSKPSSRPASGKPPPAAAAAAAEPQPQFVTVFDPSKPSDAPARRIIPPIPNSDAFHPSKKTKTLSLPLPSDDPNAQSVNHFVLDTSSADPSSSAIPFGLTLRSRDSDSDDTLRPEPVEQSMLRRFQDDMKRLPDDRGMEEFDEVPVEGFGAAILAGYGWKEGKGIGRNNKGDAKVVQYERRQGNEGLGYKPGPGDPKVSKRRGKWEKPSADRQKDAEKIVRVVSGRHAGLKGRILERRGGESEVIVKLVGSVDEVKVGEDMLAQLGSKEEEMCLRKLKDMESRRRDGKREEMSGDGRREEEEEKSRDRDGRGEDRRNQDVKREVESRGRDGKREERTSRDGRREEDEKSRDHGERREDRRNQDVRREEEKIRDRGREKRSRDEEIKPSEKSIGIGGSQWLTSHIRVRIISKDFRGGKLYRKKGKILDVIGPKICDIEMDESGELLQGVDQDVLEIALPKLGGSVLVLHGKHKGVYGSLVERDMEEENAVIRDADSHALINVHLDQIAEYVGDPSHLDY